MKSENEDPAGVQEDPARVAMRSLVKQNTLNLDDHIKSSSSCVVEPLERDNFGPLVGTKHQKANRKEKLQLMRARHQRHIALILVRLKATRVSVREPMGSLDPGSDEPAEVAENVQQLKKPIGIYDGSRFFCDCQACTWNRQTEIKADKWWAAGEVERALNYQLKACMRLLPIQFNSIKKRPIRPLMPKTPDYKHPLWKQLEIKPVEDTPPKKGPVDERALIAKAIEETEAKIRRMIGSADWTAEVVVLVTSLSANRVSYHESYRLLRFFEAKGVEHFAIDVNADIGTDSVDYGLVRTWDSKNLLMRDPSRICEGALVTVVCPQVLVDGVPLGPIEEVLTLQCEGDLDYILARAACPNCLANRLPATASCGRCGCRFHGLVSKEYVDEDDMRLLLIRSEKNSGIIKAPTPDDWERRRRQLGIPLENEDTRTWFHPSDLKKFGTPSVGFAVDF